MGRKISGERGQSPLERSALIEFSKLEKNAEVSAGEVNVVSRYVTDTPVDTSMYLTSPAEAGVGSLASIDTQRLRLCGVANS